MKSDILRMLLDDATMEPEDVQGLLNDYMKQRKKMKYISQHKYKIYQGSDGRWFTRFPREEGGSVQKAFRSRDLAEEAIVQFYEAQEVSPTLQELFELSQQEKYQEGSISEATLSRNKSDFRRFYGEFGQTQIKDITVDSIDTFIRTQKGLHHLNSNGYANLLAVTRSIFKYAKRKHFISFRIDDVLEDIEWGKNAFRTACKDDEEEVFTDDEVNALAGYFKRKPTGKHLGLLIVFATGLRIGELAALKWADVREDGLYVHRTETTWVDEDHHTHCEVRNLPKTRAGQRRVPIPTSGKWIIEELRKLNPDGEYVFMLNGSRTRAIYFRKALYNACDAVGIPRRSPHKIRKTYASILLDNNVAPKLIIETMGHTDISTTNGSYARRRKTAMQRQQVIDSIPEFDPIAR